MEILVIFILTLFNGFFALSEIALVSVKRSRIEHLAAEPEVKYEAKELEPCIAEAFIKFAIEKEFDFWQN